MGWINSHVVTTKPITDINGHLIPKGTELITIYGTKEEIVPKQQALDHAKTEEFIKFHGRKLNI